MGNRLRLGSLSGLKHLFERFGGGSSLVGSGLLGSLFGRFGIGASSFLTALEFLNLTLSINKALLAGIERVTGTTNRNLNLRLG